MMGFGPLGSLPLLPLGKLPPVKPTDADNDNTDARDDEATHKGDAA